MRTALVLAARSIVFLAATGSAAGNQNPSQGDAQAGDCAACSHAARVVG